MQECAGHGDVAVDAGELCGERAHALGHREAVLKQPVPVGLVVVLGRGRLVVLRADQVAEQVAKVGPLDGLDERVEVGAQLRVRDRRALHEVGQRVLAFGGGAHPLDRERTAVALVDAVEAQDADDGAARADWREPVHLVPDHGLERPGDVAQPELQEGLAVASLAPAVCPDDEDRVDLLTVGQVAYEALRGHERGLLHRLCQGSPGFGRDRVHDDGVAPRRELLT